MKAVQSLPAPLSTPVPVVQPSEGGLDLGQVLATLRRKALLIAGVTIAVSSAAGAAALLNPPKYATGFDILIQSDTPEGAVLASIPDALTGKNTQPSAVTPDLIKILSSPRLITPVLQKLEAQHPGACSALVSASAGHPVKFKTLDASALDSCYSTVFSGLTITSGGRNPKVTTEASTILGVVFQSEDAKDAEAFSKLLSQAYLDFSLQTRQANVRRGLQFVDKKLPDLQSRVNALQGQLQQLRQTYNIIDPASRGAQLSGEVSTFSQQQLDNQLQLSELRSIYADLQAQLAQQPSEIAASSALDDNPRFQTLLNQILDQDSKIAAAATLFLGTSPDMQVLQEQRQNLVGLLANEGEQAQRQLASKIRELETRDQSLQATIGNLDGSVQDLSGIARVYADIQRDLDVSTQTLNQFLAKREALQIEGAQQEIPWDILTPASRPSPSNASVTQNLILGALLGFLLGTGAALVVDRLTDVLYSAEELKRLTGLPLLGAIPLNRNLEEYRTQRAAALPQVRATPSLNGDPTRADAYRADPFFEAFRSLFANLRLLNTDNPVRSLVISSTSAEEGKSVAATYLAQAAAAMGRRVLLVDTDLRRPQLHHYMNLENGRGLTDIMSDARELHEVMLRSPHEPNLWVLTSGNVPPDPTRFLASQKMQHLMEQIQNQFDLVIYDAPPLLGFADAFLVAAHTDGLMLVAELGKLKRSLLEQAMEQATVSNTSILGIVVQKAAGTQKKGA